MKLPPLNQGASGAVVELELFEQIKFPDAVAFVATSATVVLRWERPGGVVVDRAMEMVAESPSTVRYTTVDDDLALHGQHRLQVIVSIQGNSLRSAVLLLPVLPSIPAPPP